MPRITRITASIFGSTAGTGQLAVFGSLAAGSPQLLSPGSPGLIQSSEFLNGWYSGVLDGAAPTLQDTNSLDYLTSYQIAYILQQGIPEYDTATTYYTDNFVSSSGSLYVSLQDNNLNNAVSVGSYWKAFSSGSPGANQTLSNLSSPVLINQNLTFGSPVQIGDSSGTRNAIRAFIGKSILNTTYPNNAVLYPGFSFLGDNPDVVTTVGATTGTVTGFPGFKAFLGYNTSFGNEFGYSSTMGFWADAGSSMDVIWATSQINLYPGAQTTPLYKLGADGTFGLLHPTQANLNTVALGSPPGIPGSGTVAIFAMTDNNLYIEDSSGSVKQIGGGSGGSPGGTPNQLQFNNSGSFGGITGSGTDGSTYVALPALQDLLLVPSQLATIVSQGVGVSDDGTGQIGPILPGAWNIYSPNGSTVTPYRPSGVNSTGPMYMDGFASAESNDGQNTPNSPLILQTNTGIDFSCRIYGPAATKVGFTYSVTFASSPTSLPPTNSIDTSYNITVTYDPTVTQDNASMATYWLSQESLSKIYDPIVNNPSATVTPGTWDLQSNPITPSEWPVQAKFKGGSIAKISLATINGTEFDIANNGNGLQILEYGAPAITVAPRETNQVTPFGSEVLVGIGATSYATSPGHTLAVDGDLGVNGAVVLDNLVTGTSATLGGAMALPVTPAGYAVFSINGSSYKIPFYNT